MANKVPKAYLERKEAYLDGYNVGVSLNTETSKWKDVKSSQDKMQRAYNAGFLDGFKDKVMGKEKKFN